MDGNTDIGLGRQSVFLSHSRGETRDRWQNGDGG